MGNCSSSTVDATTAPVPSPTVKLKDVSVHGGSNGTPRESVKGILLKEGQIKIRTLSRVSWKDIGALDGEALPGFEEEATAGPAAKLAALGHPPPDEVAATLCMLKFAAADGSGSGYVERSGLDEAAAAEEASGRAADAALATLSVGASALSQRAGAARQDLLAYEDAARAVVAAAAAAAAGGSVAGPGSGVRRAMAEELAEKLEGVAAAAADAGRAREALALCLHAHSLKAFSLGPSAAEAAHCLVRVAQVLKQIGHLPQAELLAKHAAHQTAEGFGLQHRAPGEALMLCGELLGMQGRFEEARAHLRCALELHIAAVGRQTTETADVFMQLGELHRQRLLYDEAARLFRQAYNTRKRVLGTRNSVTAAALEALAGVMQDSQQYVQAEQLLTQLLQLHTDMHGSGVVSAASVAAMGRLAAVQAADGRAWEAEATLKRAQAAAIKLFGADHPTTVSINLDLARLLINRKDASEVQLRAAEQLLRACLRPAGRSAPGAAGVAGAKGGGAGGGRGAMGAMAAKHKHAAAAAAQAAGGGGPGWEEGSATISADAQVLLAELVTRRGRHEEAERLYTTALETYTRLHGAEHAVTARCMCALATTMAQRGRSAAGETMAKRALAAAVAAHGDAHPAVANCFAALGDNQAAKGYPFEAAASYRSAYRILLAANGPEDEETQRAARTMHKLEDSLGIAPQEE